MDFHQPKAQSHGSLQLGFTKFAYVDMKGCYPRDCPCRLLFRELLPLAHHVHGSKSSRSFKISCNKMSRLDVVTSEPGVDPGVLERLRSPGMLVHLARIVGSSCQTLRYPKCSSQVVESGELGANQDWPEKRASDLAGLVVRPNAGRLERVESSRLSSRDPRDWALVGVCIMRAPLLGREGTVLPLVVCSLR